MAGGAAGFFAIRSIVIGIHNFNSGHSVTVSAHSHEFAVANRAAYCEPKDASLFRVPGHSSIPPIVFCTVFVTRITHKRVTMGINKAALDGSRYYLIGEHMLMDRFLWRFHIQPVLFELHHCGGL